jgi:hypothetical protein
MTLQEELEEVNTRIAAVPTMNEWGEGSKRLRVADNLLMQLYAERRRIKSQMAKAAIGGSVTIDPVR